MILKNKTALITGTNRGIGKAILEDFAKNGANIFAHARLETPEFLALIQRLSSKYNVDIRPVYFDLINDDMMKSAVKEIRSYKCNIDILVNNAGVLHNSSFQMSSEATLREHFDINFFAPFLLTQYVSKIMVKHNFGSIINIASIAALDGREGKAVYAASKAAIIAMSKVIATELGRFGIRSNCLAPGIITTEMVETMPPEAVKEFEMSTSLNRLGTPLEVAELVTFLASDSAKYITGQVIRIDGGLS